MTETQVARAADLIFARGEIKQFLSCRDPNSELLQDRAASEYEHVRKDAKRTPGAKYADIHIMDADNPHDENADTMETFRLPRDILERALSKELQAIEAELSLLGVTPDAAG